MITTTELLEFLCKARKLSPSCLDLRQTDKGYKITLYLDWYGDNDWHKQGVFITNEGESDWDNVIEGVQFFEFDTMNRTLDEMLVEQAEKEIKARKRKQLIESLTPEQRELLGV
jgi:hypothetical protein